MTSEPQARIDRGPSIVLLQLFGATVALIGFFGVVGALLRGVGFNEIGLPAERAISLVPIGQLIAIGADAVGPAVLYAAIATIIVSVFGPLNREGKPRLLFLAILLALLATPLVIQAVHHEYSLNPEIALLVGAIVAAEVAVWLVGRGPAGTVSVGWMVFAIAVGLGGVGAYVRNLDDPQLEPVAVIRTGDAQGISGFYIGENSDAVYVAPLSPLDQSGRVVARDRDVDDVLEIPRRQVDALRVGQLASVEGADAPGSDAARELLAELTRENRVAENTAPPTVLTETPGATFAPLVSLHDDDPSYPTSADFFLENSWLMWAHPGGCEHYSVTLERHIGDPDSHRAEIMGEFDPGGLAGADAYTHTISDGCTDQPGASFPADAFTRPSDSSARAEGVPPDQGFYLDLWDGRRFGEDHVAEQAGQAILEGVPAYFEGQQTPDSLRVTYWLFYPLSQPPGPTEITKGLIHEGDWERISVFLRRGPGADEYLPLSVTYHTHDEFLELPWSQVEKIAAGGGAPTHPVVYSARGSHASYPESGEFKQFLRVEGRPIQDFEDVAKRCAACPEWHTWENLLKAREEPWYGFGGAWGELRPGSKGGNGPLGPSPYKLTAKEADPVALGNDAEASGEVEQLEPGKTEP